MSRIFRTANPQSGDILIEDERGPTTYARTISVDQDNRIWLGPRRVVDTESKVE
jgi:hypothetical protein